MRSLRILPLLLLLPLVPNSGIAATTATLSCPTSDQLLRASIDCAREGKRPSLVRDDACRAILCEEFPLCAAPVTVTAKKARIQQLEAKAYTGNAEAMYVLGNMYHTGQGAGKNDVRAFAWLALADQYGYRIPNDEDLQAYFVTALTDRQIVLAYDLVRTLGAKISRGAASAVTVPRNAQRKADIEAILAAIERYSQDTGGALPAAFSQTPSEICASGGAACTGYIDLSKLLQRYLVAIPRDPLLSGPDGTWYFIYMDATGRITIAAPHAEGGEPITVTR